MTLVCVRLNESYGMPRLTALADTRATIRRPDKSLEVVSDTTVKLFAIPVCCYTLEAIDTVVGSWADPYFQTTIGLGFSGSCFEALTAIAHIGQRLVALVAPNGDQPVPAPKGLVNLIGNLCETYFQHHSGEGAPILQLLVFGFDSDKPWIAKITWEKETGLTSDFSWATHETLMTAGQDDRFRQYAEDLRAHIQKHKKSISKKSTPATDDVFERELEVARHDLAERKATEEGVLREIEEKFVEGIGGILQRLELAVADGKVVAGFTRDDRDYAIDDAGYSVAPGTLLGFIPFVEKMGRRMRKRSP
jgi:hypothetical protein